jgi:hypothetical protein
VLTLSGPAVGGVTERPQESESPRMASQSSAIQTTERYLGGNRQLRCAVNEREVVGRLGAEVARRMQVDLVAAEGDDRADRDRAAVRGAVEVGERPL